MGDDQSLVGIVFLALVWALGHRSTGGRMPRNFALSPDGRFLLARWRG